MPVETKKLRYTPMEVAQMLKISIGKFNEQVAEGVIPKGRLGEDGRRYYTDKDIEFIKREWRSKTTVRFFLFTFPLILVGTFIIIATFHEISQHISANNSTEEPTPQIGYAAPPPLVWSTKPSSSASPTESAPTPGQRMNDYYGQYRHHTAQQRRFELIEPEGIE